MGYSDGDRLGFFDVDRVVHSGFHFLIPFLERAHIYSIALKTENIEDTIFPTNDNLWIIISGNYTWRIVDVINFHKIIRRPEYCTQRLEQIFYDCLADIVGKNLFNNIIDPNTDQSTIDAFFENPDSSVLPSELFYEDLNEKLFEHNETFDEWGIEIMDIELSISPQL